MKAVMFLHMSDVTLDLRYNRMNVHTGNAEPWKVTLIDTGATTQAGGRLKRVRDYIGSETFCLTYAEQTALFAPQKSLAGVA